MAEGPGCLDENTVVALFRGALGAAELARIDAHIDECPECRLLISRFAREEFDSPPPSSGASRLLAGRFELLEHLRSGGMGDVYRAKDRKTDRPVAVKVIRRLEDVSRFEREAQLLATLSHSAIVEYVAHGEFDGLPFLAMEWLEGEDLAERLTRGPLSEGEVRRLGVRIAAALARTHAIGVVHRDIKPSNVFLPGGDVNRAKLLDFGVAFAAPSDNLSATLTRSGTLLGTLTYMAPEQARGATSVDARADVFSLGCVLFECLTGKRAFGGAHAVEVLAKILADPAPRPSEHVAGVPADLDDLVVHMMAKDPAERPADCALIAEEIGRARVPRRLKRLWIFAAVAAGAATITGVVHLARRSAPVAPHTSTQPPERTFHPQRPRRITFDETCAEFPSFTPDARAIVYDATVGESSYIYERTLERNDPPRQLTTVDGWDMAAAVSPDGARIAFHRVIGGRGSIAILDRRAGATPRILAAGTRGRPTWARDGRSVWTSSDAGLERYDADSGALVEKAALPTGTVALLSIELADGRQLVEMPPVHGSGLAGIAILGAGDRAFQWLLRGEVDEVLAAAPDGQRALAARVTPADESELVDVPFDASGVTSLANAGITARKGLDVSRDGRRVAWSTCGGVSRLVVVGDDGGVEPLLPAWKWGEVGAAWIPNTTRGVVVSSRGGFTQPWVVDLGNGAPPRAIDVGDIRPVGVSVSNDGAWLAISSFGHPLHAVRTDGSTPARAVSRTTHDLSPSFVRGSHDVLFHAVLPDGHPQIQRVSVEGGEPTVLIERDARAPDASPTDGRVLYLAGDQDGELVPMLFDSVTRKSTRVSPALAPAMYSAVRFTPDGKRAVVSKNPKHVVVDLATGAVVRTIEIDGVGVSFFEKRMVVAARAWQGDLWMADDPF